MADTLSYRANKPGHVPDNALTLLVRRLEAATSRLEDMASSAVPDHADGGQAASKGVVAPSASAPELPGLPMQSSIPETSAPAESSPPAIAAMDELIDGDVKKFTSLAQELDSTISEQVWYRPGAAGQKSIG